MGKLGDEGEGEDMRERGKGELYRMQFRPD